MKVFMAIDFEEEYKEFFKEYEDLIKQYSIKGNFTSKENFHLTLKFIGNIDASELEKLKQTIDEVAQITDNFTIKVCEVGYFEKQDKKIIWAGIKNSEYLEKINNELEESLFKKGYEKENKKFKAHITIGREVVLNCTFDEIQKDIIIDKEIPVKSISLMESTRVNGELKYIPIYVQKLK